MLVLDNMMDHEISGAHVKAEVADESTGANRRKLPDKAPSVRKKFRVGQVEGYIHVGLYPDSRKPGEVFITVSKEGSTLAGVMDSFATALSLALQYGVPLEDLVEKFKNQRFEPSGFTGDEIQSATSIVDYVAKWLEHHFLKATDPDGDENIDWMDESEDFDSTKTTSRTTFEEDHALSTNGATDGKDDPRSEETYRDTSGEETSGKVCHNCGSQMQRDGTCYVCPVCGEDTGCGG
jgi:ribonucleoside-diphosphate reductase alpha chain